MISPLITGSSASYSYGSGGSVAVVSPRDDRARVRVFLEEIAMGRSIAMDNRMTPGGEGCHNSQASAECFYYY